MRINALAKFAEGVPDIYFYIRAFSIIYAVLLIPEYPRKQAVLYESGAAGAELTRVCYITKAMIRLYVYPVSKMICLGKWYEYLVQGRVYDYHAYI
ncbi:predicted protein [Sclerotinia sclerotiorum 1980 UF-70]|uniref:Uncharacterized protein n=1 Tax=Sclerotinia sclerotiorum (strain ATCC 18683 / 1980 / Ss-1) TaxID=665079 RepID=A7F6A3_SCLS1|nr:predicted protein [Sclerotinia sclerotiorum 1980 UF-70]EDN98274.1 predicted protein [Sclerotinia sclerotiorum 1980 UF-70]